VKVAAHTVANMLSSFFCASAVLRSHFVQHEFISVRFGSAPEGAVEYRPGEVYLIFQLQGEYDDILPWPFGSKVTLVLLDQSSNRKHLTESFRPDPKSSSFQKPRDELNVACGCPKFVSHAALENASDSLDTDGRMFVQNDTVYLKVIVDQLDMRSV
jgi:hypothetical protein